MVKSYFEHFGFIDDIIVCGTVVFNELLYRSL